MKYFISIFLLFFFQSIAGNNGIVYRLDSIVNVYENQNHKKHEYLYDSDNREIMHLYYTKENDSYWLELYRYEYLYDESGNKESILFSVKDNFSDTIVYSKKTDFIYDETNFPAFETNYRWLNDVWIPTTRYEKRQDEQGRPILYAAFHWNETKEDWDGEIKQVDIYDDAEKLHSTESYVWNVGINNWSGTTKYIQSFDLNENISSFDSFVWDEFAQTWKTQERANYTYVENNLISTVQFCWDDENNDWEMQQNTMLRYDDKNKISSYIQYQKDEKGDLTESQRIKYEFQQDERGNITLNRTYLWNPNSNEWFLYNKTEYQYDTSNHEISNSAYAWNSKMEELMPIGHSEKSYDGKGREIASLLFSLNPENNHLEDNNKIEYEYDNNGNQTSVTYYKWIISKELWVKDRRIVSLYNNHNNRITEEYYRWNDDSWEIQNYNIYYFPTPKYEINAELRKCSNNRGEFSLYINKSVNSLITGQLQMMFPEKFNLDTEQTLLTPVLQEPMNLTIETQENSSLFNFTLKSAVDTLSETYRYFLDVYFDYDKSITKGEFQIVLDNINLLLVDRDSIINDSIIIPITIDDKTGDDDDVEENPYFSCYILNNMLYIESNEKESIEIFTVRGIKINTGEKEKGKYAVDVSYLSHEILIVKAGVSGVKKLIK